MAEKKVKSTEIAMVGQVTEQNIPNLIAQIDARLEQLGADKEKNARITGELAGMKVSDVRDVEELRGLYAYITAKAEKVSMYDDVFKGVAPTTKLKPYTEGGHNVKQWQAEILTQFREVTFEAEVKQLKEAKKAFQDCLSEEAKREAKLQAAGDALRNLLNNE